MLSQGWFFKPIQVFRFQSSSLSFLHSLNMHINTLILASLPLAANAINIVQSNDDGWAEINLRTFYKTLKSAGYAALISAPAVNKSGTGSTTATPKALTTACEFNSCPAGSPATGSYAGDANINYVNSYPATAIEYGIDTFAPKIFGKKPDLAVAGPNVGSMFCHPPYRLELSVD